MIKYLAALALVMLPTLVNAQKVDACEKRIISSIVTSDNMTGICNDIGLSQKENSQLKIKFTKQAKSKLESIKSQFKDPDSVKLKNLKLSESGLVICGDVNAKNSYGGYGGFKRFYYTWMIDALRLEGDDSFLIERFSIDCLSAKPL